MTGDVVRSDLTGLTVTCPDGWRAASDVAVAGVQLVQRDRSSGTAAAVVHITTEPLPAEVDVTAYADRQLALLRATAEALRLLDEEDGTLAGLPARRVLVAYRQGLAHLVGDQWWAVGGGRGVVGRGVVVAGTCLSTAFPAAEVVFAEIAATVRLAPEGSARER